MTWDLTLVFQLKDIPVKEDIRTLPNFLTLTRLLISPVIGYLILNENYKVAFAAFCYAGFTDVVGLNINFVMCNHNSRYLLFFTNLLTRPSGDKLDGYIARHYNMRTMIGTIIDPAADKTLMTIMTVSLAAKGLLPSESDGKINQFLYKFNVLTNSVYINQPH